MYNIATQDMGKTWTSSRATLIISFEMSPSSGQQTSWIKKKKLGDKTLPSGCALLDTTLIPSLGISAQSDNLITHHTVKRSYS